MTAATTACTAARTEAEQHGNKGEQAIAQAHLALTTAFTDPTRAEGEIAYAEQLLAGLDQRATTLTAQVAELVRMAGRVDGEFADRTNRLRTEIAAGGITAVALLLDIAVVFHHAVRGDEAEVHEALRRLAELTAGGDYAYYLDIAHHMAGLALSAPTSVRWAGDADAVPARWRALVTARR